MQLQRTARQSCGFTRPNSEFRVPHLRRAFTLIELLVVMAIMVALASITLLFLPSRQSRLASQGADQLQTFIASARSRALRDQAPRGVRLLNDGTGAGFREVQLLEVPEALAPNSPITLANVPAPPNVAQTATATGYTPSPGDVQPGDLLEVIYGGGSVHKVTGLGPPIALATPVPGAAVTSLPLTNNYRFIRQARPLMGEPTLQLPNTVYVMDNQTAVSTTVPGSQNIPGSTVPGARDIIFAPSGQVIAATSGRIILWVTDDNSVSKPTLLTVYTRTGSIAAHPAAPTTAPGGIFGFTLDGRSSGQ